ncbi:reverse transcriptase domain-containing protein [Tanacetum coccineum]
MEDDYKPVIQPQRRLNLKVQDVVKNKIVKLLDSGLIYLISDSSWVSPIHVVPKKGGMTVVLNDNNQLIPSRTVTEWRVCIDYHKLNDATRKDHFPLPFIDQMLERLCGNEYYCFLDGFSGFFQIPIAPEDQENTTFTCPYGTFAYRRMPFGLSNLDRMLARSGIEVDRAKIDVIAKLPYPTNVKGVRSFLGHAGFYRRFIKDFSMISKPMTQLLMKDAKFDFSDDCKKAFNILKEKLTSAPIIISPDWNEPFELMCDASDFIVGAVLGQQIDGKFKPIYYASKTLNNSQEHYTTTEKELLAVVFYFDKFRQFRQYLVLLQTMVYTDHSAFKYLFSKEDAKPRLIRWVLLLQGFDIEIKDKKGAENLAADHLSRLENPDLGTFAEEEITDEFPDEHLMILKAELNNDEPCASITGRKVYESGFYWPSIFKDAKDYVMKCDACQRSGNISSRRNSQVKNCKINLLTQEYEKFLIFNEETIDSLFTRLNAIVTSLKSLDPDYSSKSHVRKFLRTILLKWRAKVTTIEEAKDLATLPLDELDRNLKAYEMVLDNDGVGSKTTKEKVKSLDFKAKVTSEIDKLQFWSFCEQHGMSYNLSGLFTSQSSNVVERTHRYFQTSKAYTVLNKETMRIKESLNVTFDESLPEPKSYSVEDDRINEPMVHDLNGLPSLQVNVLDEGYPKSLKEARGHPIKQLIGELNDRTLRSKSKQA